MRACDDLVRVHVATGAMNAVGTRRWEMCIGAAFRHFERCLSVWRTPHLVEVVQVEVRPAGPFGRVPLRGMKPARHAQTAEGKVMDRHAGLCTQSGRGARALAHAVRSHPELRFVDIARAPAAGCPGPGGAVEHWAGPRAAGIRRGSLRYDMDPSISGLSSRMSSPPERAVTARRALRRPCAELVRDVVFQRGPV